MLDYALDYAAQGWEVFPLGVRSKAPMIPKRCGGNGVLDATDDPEVIRGWWGRWPAANIGGRVPRSLFVNDIDPRHGGDVNLRRLIDEHDGQWNRTLTQQSGGGGWHSIFAHPGGTIVESRLPKGVEIKTSAGYIVLAPSQHPDGGFYRWPQPMRPIDEPVGWFVDLLRPPAPAPRPARPLRPWPGSDDASPADWFTATYRWSHVLIGWTVVAGDGESDGSRWRHPAATSAWSATIRHGLLFNYSPNAGLPVTEAGRPEGLTRFRAWAHLDHWGDLSAAAKAARELRGERRTA